MSRWNVTAGSVTIDGANPALRERYPTVPQGVSADLIASVEGFTRRTSTHSPPKANDERRSR